MKDHDFIAPNIQIVLKTHITGTNSNFQQLIYYQQCQNHYVGYLVLNSIIRFEVAKQEQEKTRGKHTHRCPAFAIYQAEGMHSVSTQQVAVAALVKVFGVGAVAAVVAAAVASAVAEAQAEVVVGRGQVRYLMMQNASINNFIHIYWN